MPPLLVRKLGRERVERASLGTRAQRDRRAHRRRARIRTTQHPVTARTALPVFRETCRREALRAERPKQPHAWRPSSRRRSVSYKTAEKSHSLDRSSNRGRSGSCLPMRVGRRGRRERPTHCLFAGPASRETRTRQEHRMERLTRHPPAPGGGQRHRREASRALELRSAQHPRASLGFRRLPLPEGPEFSPRSR